MTADAVCAIVPAAGRGNRLGLDKPKLLVPIVGDRTVWCILKEKLLPLVDHIHVVLSPQGSALLKSVLQDDPDRRRISVSVQQEPRGMGDAVFCGHAAWAAMGTLVVVWGDQLSVSADTLSRALNLFRIGQGPRCVVPVVEMENPYVQYCFEGDHLREIRESREGARCDPRGFSDVGIFVLPTKGIREAWGDFLCEAKAGGRTGESNFLPFLAFLARRGWLIQRLVVADPLEARGINTPEDLDFFRRLYRERDPYFRNPPA